MQRFYHFLGDHRGYVTLGIAVVLSLAMLSMDTTAKLRFARGVAAQLLSVGHWVFAWPMELSGLRFENRVLREQNMRLSLELLKFREARLENKRLHDLLAFRSSQVDADAYFAAKVIARNPGRIANTILIDAGEVQGVSARMPVVTADGLVGRVLEAHRETAVVQLLLDRNSRVSAVVQRENRTQGIVLSDGGVFYLTNVPVRSDIEVGDLVVSSGLGEVFPKGLYVGRVARLGEEGQELFREVILTPGVNFASLEEVFVLKTLARVVE